MVFITLLPRRFTQIPFAGADNLTPESVKYSAVAVAVVSILFIPVEVCSLMEIVRFLTSASTSYCPALAIFHFTSVH